MATTDSVKTVAVDYQALESVCRAHGLQRLRLVGVSSEPNVNGLNDNGDIDLMYDLRPDRHWSLLDLVGCADDLSPLFGDKYVHLFTPDSLKTDGERETVFRRAKTIYEE